MTTQYIPINQLKIHPQNIRQFYPETDVAEMAASIAAVGGVLQALLVVPTGQRDVVNSDDESLPTYYVVDGNMRLTAARTLAKCPPLKCETITSNHAEQLLVMATTSYFYYPKDFISKARHYQRLVRDEGLTPLQIAELTGMSASSIYNALTLLEITDPEVQVLIATGKLPYDIGLYRTLARIPDPAKRLELAERFAARGFSAKVALKSVRHVLQQYERLSRLAAEPEPAPVNGNGQTAPRLPVVPAPLPPRAAPRQANANRQPGKFTADKVAELAALHLCPGCRLDGLGDGCYTCPGVYEFVNHLVDLLPAETLPAAVGEKAAA